MKRSELFKKIKGTKGIYEYKANGSYKAEKRIKGKLYVRTFKTLFEAKQWQKTFDGTDSKDEDEKGSDFSTLKEVWERMQTKHFPTLSTSTKEMWVRRYELIQNLEHLSMDRINPSKITE